MNFEGVRFSSKMKLLLFLLVIGILGVVIFLASHNNGICLTVPDAEFEKTYWSYIETTEDGEQEYLYYFDDTGTILSLHYPTLQTVYVKQWNTWRAYYGNLLEKKVYKKGYDITFSRKGDSLRIVEVNNKTGEVVRDFTMQKRTLTSDEVYKYYSNVVAGMPEVESNTDIAVF